MLYIYEAAFFLRYHAWRKTYGSGMSARLSK